MFLREWHVKRELRRLLAQNSRQKKIFDAGCGFGQYSFYCAKKFHNLSIHAIDLKREQIEDCRRFFKQIGIENVSVTVEDLTQPLHENEFDVVLSVDVMEHIPDDVVVFRNLDRALKSGGRLLLHTPSNLGGSDVDSETGTSFIEEHARTGYGVDEIRTKLQAAGFEIEQIKFTYGPFGSLAWRLGVKYPMLILNASKLLFPVLFLYYIVVVPIILPFMFLDYILENKTGTGLLVIARKP